MQYHNINPDLELGYTSIITNTKSSHSNLYILDSGASIHILNENIFTNNNNNIHNNHYNKINPTNKRIQGIAGINIRAKYEGYHNVIGHYLVIPTAAVNLLSISELTKHNITIKFIENKTIIYTDTSNYTIRVSSDGLYYITMDQLMNIINNSDSTFIGVSKSTEAHSYTPKQKARAAKVHMLHYQLGHPSNTALKNVYRMGTSSIQNLQYKM